MPSHYNTLADPSLDARFKRELGAELAQRAQRRMAVARQPIAGQEGGANVGLMGGPVVRGGALGDRAQAQAGQQSALGAALGGVQAITAQDEAQARADFDRARLQEMLLENQRIADTFANVGSIVQSGSALGMRAGQAVHADARKKKESDRG
jgi:hypothetical protein